MVKAPTPSDYAAAYPYQDKPGTIREESTGARNVIRSLEELGVKTVFGLPGGAALPMYDALFDSTRVRHILVRHEQGGGHAAEGLAVATGTVGVAFATSGPGATNLVTALLDAYMDSVPVVFITGQVGTSLIGTDAFQEADIVGATMPMVKHSYLVTDPADVPARIAEAFHLASTGRPGPVLVDIPKSVQAEAADFVWPPKMDLPGFNPQLVPSTSRVMKAATAMATAKRPVFYVGGGLVRSGAAADFAMLVEKTGIPVVTTLNARGVFPDSDSRNLGMPGMHGTVPAVAALQRADLLITLGARFDDRVTGKLDEFAPQATVIHADIDPAEISKNRYADIALVGDLGETVPALVEAMDKAYDDEGHTDLDPWWVYLNDLVNRYPVMYDEPEDGLMSPQFVLTRLGEANPHAYFTTGVGQHQMWAQQVLGLDNPRHFVTSCGAGTMGFGIPSAMGVKAALPNETVWAIDGDGSFQMTNQELATCTLNNINIKVALINNSSLGMVRQWQNLFYESRYSNTDLDTGHDTRRIPNFELMAQAYGAHAIRVTSPDQVDAAIAEANSINDRPVVVEFVVSPDAMVWPMVPAGVSNADIQYARGIRPTFEEE